MMRRRDYRAFRAQGLPVHAPPLPRRHRHAAAARRTAAAAMGELVIVTNLSPSRRNRWLP